METKYGKELARIRNNEPGRDAGNPVTKSGHPQEWLNLTPEQRVIHYNRNLPVNCPHTARLGDWPKDLQESYSFDPYAHVSHSEEL